MRSGALKHGDKAFGHRFLKPGFSFSEQTDLAFALGFPSLTFVVDGHPDDGDPLANLYAWRVYGHACLPATIALYLVRDQASGHPVVRGAANAPWLATRQEPLTPAELSRLVASCIDEMFSVHALYRLEALTNTDEVLAMLMSEFERLVAENDLEKLDDSGVISVVDSALPSMPLRTTEPARSAHQEMLAGLYRNLDDVPDMQAAIDVALDRGTDNEDPRFRVHGAPDVETYVAWLAEREIDESSYPNAREAFLGGDAGIEILRTRWREYKAVAREDLVSQHAWIRSEQVVLLFLDLLRGAPKLKPEVTAWFLEHVDYARPILLDVEKKGGVEAATAKKALKQLDADLGGRAAPAAEKRPAKKT
jgi:hypothetical protein